MLVRGQGCDSFAQVVPKTVRLLFGIPRRGVQIKVFHLSDEKVESEYAPSNEWASTHVSMFKVFRQPA